MARTDKVRYQLFLPKALSRRLEELGSHAGSSKSAILAAAVSAYFENSGTSEAEQLFGQRLDRISRQLARIERDGQVLLESLALFIRYMLTINAPLAEEDEVLRAIGRDRFEAFVARVGRHIAAGRRTFDKEARP